MLDLSGTASSLCVTTRRGQACSRPQQVWLPTTHPRVTFHPARGLRTRMTKTPTVHLVLSASTNCPCRRWFPRRPARVGPCCIQVGVSALTLWSGVGGHARRNEYRQTRLLICVQAHAAWPRRPNGPDGQHVIVAHHPGDVRHHVQQPVHGPIADVHGKAAGNEGPLCRSPIARRGTLPEPKRSTVYGPSDTSMPCARRSPGVRVPALPPRLEWIPSVPAGQGETCSLSPL